MDSVWYWLSEMGGGGHPIIGIFNLMIWAIVLMLPVGMLLLILSGNGDDP